MDVRVYWLCSVGFSTEAVGTMRWGAAWGRDAA